MSNKITPKENWSSGDLYERYVGRWSRVVARDFIRWLAVPDSSHWLDVGCGTGALSQTILELANPRLVKGIDRSEDYVQTARHNVDSPRAEFETGDAQTLPVASDAYDAAVSGLVLNFVPEPKKMADEMKRSVCAGGTVAVYVWDYADRMQFMRYFWDAAAALDPDMQGLDEGKRFPICDPDALFALFHETGLRNLEVRPIDIPTHFKDFDDYWSPFLGGQGPAPSYLMSLSEERRAELRDHIKANLPIAPDGSIPLVARAWAVKGIK